MRRVTKSLQQLRFGCNVCEPEIDNDDFEQRIPFHQNVFGFEIAMNHLFRVKMLELIEDLFSSSHIFIVSGVNFTNVLKVIKIYNNGELWVFLKLKHL